MGKVIAIDQQIEMISPDDLAAFRLWEEAFDVEPWDRQFEAHMKAGRFNVLADKAFYAYAAGQSKLL